MENKIDKIQNVSASKKASKQIVIDDDYKLVDFFYFELDGYSKGKCLLVASEYKRMQPGSETKGILVYDEKKKAWIIHVMFLGNPFDSVLRQNGSAANVKLKQISGGIAIDGTTYHFLKNGDNSVTTIRKSYSTSQFVKELRQELIDAEKCLLDSLSRFEDGANIFNSNDEVELLRQEALRYQKRIGILHNRLPKMT